ncbi:uncharacterized protein DUF4845 [Panacagrimonas perspica]|uniref:Uncharacterized protein DUF4845 n=1 Tax=Panacagrimonas perspica TaxID=381431 RepID=A0A4V3F4N4_9GAMM|nr:DUF4845 domain-containing protein [Panacagrimonas perspica]TDU25866.1 uncharacterized protein DUF4845 [Panacagrimonas perspica]THD02768.1 DUF4845 domain-containing protein [Panacagrimonas perspica]
MFKSLKRQRGMGWFGLTFLFGTIAFFAIIVIKVGPLYLNQGNVIKVVKGVADSPDYANASPQEIRTTLERRWDIDYINQIDDKDVKIKRSANGRMLSYDYEARVNLFYNVFVVIHFKDDFVMKQGSGDADS